MPPAGTKLTWSTHAVSCPALTLEFFEIRPTAGLVACGKIYRSLDPVHFARQTRALLDFTHINRKRSLPASDETLHQ